MKQGWEIKKLGEIASFSQGIQVGLEHHLSEPKEGYVRFIRIVDYTQNTDDIRYIPNPGEKYFINEDDIVMVRYGAPGLIGRGKAGVIANNLFRIKIERKDLTNDYLTHFLSQEHIQNYLATQGSATMPALNFGQLKTIEVKFPPLPEQQRIVTILDHAFAAIDQAKANAEKNLKNAKELFESYLQGVFEKKGEGWEEKTLGQLCGFMQGIQRDVKLQSETKDENQVRFLRIVDFTQGNEPPRFIDFPGEKYILNNENIALVRYGASTGFVCRGLEGALANNLFRIIPKHLEQLTNDFLFIYLNSPIFQNVIKTTMNGAAMPAISFGLIQKIPFPLPPIKQQQSIVLQIDALNEETMKLEAIYKKKIEDIEELKKSILQKAFAGEL